MCLGLPGLSTLIPAPWKCLGLQLGHIFADSQTWRLNAQVLDPEREWALRGVGWHITQCLAGPEREWEFYLVTESNFIVVKAKLGSIENFSNASKLEV